MRFVHGGEDIVSIMTGDLTSGSGGHDFTMIAIGKTGKQTS